METREFTVLILCFLSLKMSFVAVDCHEIDKLLDFLYTNYTSAVRPQCNSKETTNVALDMTLRQIIDINEPQQLATINVWVRMYWIDCRLVWNPPDFENISGFVVPYKNVWIPDITLYDNAEPLLSGLKDYRAKVQHGGEVSYNFPSLIKSVCALDIQYFPFDRQSCYLTFGSWAYNGFDVNVTNLYDRIGLDSFKENSEWSLVSTHASRIETLYDGVPFPTVIFNIAIHRKPLFYVVNVVFPCLLITFVAVLGFLLPPDSGEKVSLQVTVLLSLAVFQLVITNMIPASGDSFPFISIYFTLSMLIVALSCLLTVVVLRVHFKGKYGVKLSEKVRKYILIPLTKITFIDLNKYSLQPSGSKVRRNSFQQFTVRSNISDKSETSNDAKEFTNLDKQSLFYMEGILQNLKRIKEFMINNDEQRDVEKWWNVFSIAFDRLFLLFYIVCTVAVTLILTVPSQH